MTQMALPTGCDQNPSTSSQRIPGDLLFKQFANVKLLHWFENSTHDIVEQTLMQLAEEVTSALEPGQNIWQNSSTSAA